MRSTQLIVLLTAFASVASAQKDTVALVMGGTNTQGLITSYAELFGCPNAPEGGSYLVSNSPVQFYLAGGMFIDDSDGGHVLVCGGFQELLGNGQVADTCWIYYPKTNSWEQNEEMYPPLQQTRYAHYMMPMNNWNNSQDTEEYPVVFGYREEIEIYNHDGNKKWNTLTTMENSVYSVDCFAFNPSDGFYYGILDWIEKIDPVSGNHWVVEGVPESLKRPGKCAYVEVDGQPGIMTRLGYWYNLK